MRTALQTATAKDISICKEIKALSSKIEHSSEKIEQYKRTIGEHLKALFVGKSQKEFLALVREHVGYRKSRTYQLLGIADGTKSAEQVREDRRERDQKRIAKDRPTVGQNAKPSTSTSLAVQDDAQVDDDQVDDDQTAPAPAAVQADPDGSRLHKLQMDNLALTDEVAHLLQTNKLLKVGMDQLGQANQKLKSENGDLLSEVVSLRAKLAAALGEAAAPVVASPSLVPDEADTPASPKKITKSEQAYAVAKTHPDLSAKSMMKLELPELVGISLPTLAKARDQLVKEGGAPRAKRGGAPAAVPQTTVMAAAQDQVTVEETAAPDQVTVAAQDQVTVEEITAAAQATAAYVADPALDMPAFCERR